LEAITFPNKTIAAGFENVLVTMKAGPIYAGVVKTENDAELQLNSPEDGLLTLKKSEIKARERGLSAMPEELRQVLTKQDPARFGRILEQPQITRSTLDVACHPLPYGAEGPYEGVRMFQRALSGSWSQHAPEIGGPLSP
jgi:hypothetical protein